MVTQVGRNAVVFASPYIVPPDLESTVLLPQPSGCWGLGGADYVPILVPMESLPEILV